MACWWLPCHPSGLSHTTQNTAWLKRSKSQGVFPNYWRQYFLNLFYVKCDSCLWNQTRKSQTTAEGALPSTSELPGPPLEERIFFLSGFLELTLDAHSRMRRHTQDFHSLLASLSFSFSALGDLKFGETQSKMKGWGSNFEPGRDTWAQDLWVVSLRLYVFHPVLEA